jgi:hypothetical protein
MLEKDNDSRLRALIRAAFPIWFMRKAEREGLTLTAEDLPALLHAVGVINHWINTFDRPKLLELAKAAQRENIAKPRKQHAITDEDARVLLAIRNHIKRSALGADNKREAIRSLAEAKGYEIVDEYYDAGVSGAARGGRPGKASVRDAADAEALSLGYKKEPDFTRKSDAIRKQYCRTKKRLDDSLKVVGLSVDQLFK